MLVYIFLCTFPCFAILIVSSKVMPSGAIALVNAKPLLMFHSVTHRWGPWRGIFVVNSPFVELVHFMTPNPRPPLRPNPTPYVTEWVSSACHSLRADTAVRATETAVSPSLPLYSLLLGVACKHLLTIFWEGLCHHQKYKNTEGEMCPQSQDWALYLRYSVTKRKPN